MRSNNSHPKKHYRCIFNSLVWLNPLTLLLAIALIAASTPARAAEVETAIATGEIRLDGKIITLNIDQKSLVLEATAFTLPDGKSKALAPAKTKTILVPESTMLRLQGRDEPAALSDLKAGAVVAVIGRDLGSGKDLPARLIVITSTPGGGKNDNAEPPPTHLGPTPETAPAPTLVMPAEATETARSVAFSPNGRLLAVGAGDRSISIFDLSTGELRHTLKGHKGEVWSLVFSPDSKQLASGGTDSTILLWDSASGKAIQKLSGHTDAVRAMSFLADGSQLGSGSLKELVLWDTATGAVLLKRAGRIKGVKSVALAPSAAIFAAGNEDGKIELRDTMANSVKSTLTGHGGQVQALAFSPNEKYLASGSDDKTVHLWLLDEQGGTLQRSLEGQSAPITSVAFSPDSKRLATCDGAVKVWDAATGSLIATIVLSPQGENTERAWIVYTPDSRYYASPAAKALLRWRAPGAAPDTEPQPNEAYVKEYFRPGLFATVLKIQE